MRGALCALFLAGLSLMGLAAPQAQHEPLSKAELLELVRGGMPGRAVVEVMQQNGLAFEPTEEILNQFRKAGAKDVVIAAMRKSWHPAPPKLLSDEDILVLLAEDVRSERIVYMVQQRGIAFEPTEEYVQRLRASGAKEELIDALKAWAAKPFSRDHLLQSLTSGRDASQIEKEVHERGIEFNPTEEDFVKLRGAGAPESLIQVIREAKRVEPPPTSPLPPPELGSSGHVGSYELQVLWEARVTCPPSVSSVPVFASPTDTHTVIARLPCGEGVAILERDSVGTGIDRIRAPGGTEGFVQDSSLSPHANSKVSPPVPTRTAEPEYSLEGRRDRIEGTVVLSIVVDSEGNVAGAQETSKPLGHGLDEKAMEAVKLWKFKPATMEGVPVPVHIIVEVTFRLHY